MKHSPELLRIWDNPKAEEIGESPEEFLHRLGGPTWVDVPGKDQSRTRAIVTLLHGNEPSGVRAIYQWLRASPMPSVNVACFIGAIEAALEPPGFAFRTLPGHKDLNRCFREPFEGVEGQLAQEVLQRLHHMNPEALIDLHNTSGRSPCYTITTQRGDKQKYLTALFSDHLVLTDLRLGSLMEATELEIPTIAVECGGNQDPRSDLIAFEGLVRYTQKESIFNQSTTIGEVRVFEHPIRVELSDGSTVAFASSPNSETHLTLKSHVDNLNFNTVDSGEHLGWVGPEELDVFVACDADGNNRADELFSVTNGQLHIAKTGRILMMTTDPVIASSDCLFYFLPCSDR